MQQTLKNDCSLIGNGIDSVHIGQKCASGLSRPCPYSRSSASSAARLLHVFLCWSRCSRWQSTLQYLTRRHAVHFFNTTAPSPASRVAPACANVRSFPRASWQACSGSNASNVLNVCSYWRQGWIGYVHECHVGNLGNWLVANSVPILLRPREFET